MATRKKSGATARKKADGARQTWIIAAVAVLGAAGGLWYFLAGGKDATMYADPGNAELVALGRGVYDENCAACHGGNLEGQPNWRTRLDDGTLPAPPHDESGHTWHHADAQLLDIITRGGQPGMPAGFKSGMPGYDETLTERQIVAVLAYIKSRWPITIRRRQEAASRQQR